MSAVSELYPKKTILVVDDMEMNRAIIAKVFRDSYRVLSAENGADGLAVLRHEAVELVLLDIQMPVMDGYEVIRAMKADPRLAIIPVVVTTGAIDKSERKAFDLGADDFIAQPYDPYIMKKRVENLIDRCELHEMRSALKEQKRTRVILNLLGTAYWEWTRTGGYYHSDSYERYAVSEMPPKQIWDSEAPFQYIHPEDVPLMKAFMQQFPDDEVQKSAVVRCKMRDGTYRWTEMFSIAEEAPDGQLERLVSIMRDVDKEWLVQKEKLEKALQDAEAANQAKTAFLSRISHDMRTPLNGILGLTTLMQESTSDPKIMQDLAELETSGQYLLNLINDTLDVSRIESGRLELHPSVCDGRTLFNTTLGLAKAGIQAKHIRYNVHAENLPFTVLYVDVGRIQQIVMNILSNAAKFTPEGGQIDITMTNISISDGMIVDQVVIEDNGIGMSEEFLPQIFDPFSQEDGARTNSRQGTGLGMAITKSLLTLMGGMIDVESAVGKGTRVTLTLPLAMATDEQIADWKKHREADFSNNNLNGKHILLCEDHPLNAKIATRLLENKGMVVEHAENGQAAVARFAESDDGYFDAILMDIRMPVMDGIDATKAIRSLPRRDAGLIPIVAMTANAFEDDVRQTRDAGMDAHLSKPIETKKLYDTLELLLHIKRDMKRPKVLVVDDVEVNRTVICASIEQDYDILQAENGLQALEVLKANRGIGAVVTDIQMPEMDGVELIREIRKNDEYRHIAIIANTQFGDPEQEEQLLALGANDFVYKPTTPKIVEIRVRNALRKI